MYGKEVLPLSLINGSLTNITVFRHSFLCANWRNLRFYPPTCLPASVGAARVLRRENGQFFLRSEEHTSELQSRQYLVCRLLLEKKKSTCKYSTRSTTRTSPDESFQ